MTTATLIKKEPLPNNFKLIFRNQARKEYFLILHKNQRETYNQLEINENYSYTWKKGNKNYYFINSQSIRKIRKEVESLPSTKVQTNKQYQKDFFIQRLIKDLQLKDLTEKEIFNKMESLKSELKKISQSDNLSFTLKQVKAFITTLFLKHVKLEKEKGNHDYTEQEQKESNFLHEIALLFLYDWIHWQDKGENKYKQNYQKEVAKQ